MRFFDSGLTASAQDGTGKMGDLAAQSDTQEKGKPTVQNEAEAGSRASIMSQRKTPRSVKIATWAVRACFAFVFVVSVQCALGFALTPEAYMGAYELSGVPGRVGIQGIGIAFLMWNCTYPLVIWRPDRHRALAGVVLAQQVVGLIGESAIRATLPAGHSLLASSIDLFITFDTLGLVLMGASWTTLILCGRS
ncbi:hypothetical protein VJ918_10345 [Adlercreutzia sp. R21]|uniref:hypothetical protein n=1 Tax=Adlercreutzia wanghongyangiae TaxID=3111451 RepID=UPI002DBD9D9A|nr:hypothetical protein [Adlercreutzia sp. R21]MEC4185209.1 hypothetical protein [Adlercreutzia sp. R21]